MKKYVFDKFNIRHEVDFCEIIFQGKTGVWIDNERHELKVYYRSPRTWDDYYGNTDCGYYVIAPLPTGERKRVYKH